MSIKARPEPARKPALFGTFSTHHKGTVAHAWDVLLGKRPLPLTQRFYEKAVRQCVEFLWEDRVLGEGEAPSFRHYLIHVAKPTDDASGDFIYDVCRDPTFPALNNNLDSVVWRVSHNPEAVEAARRLWREYEQWLGKRPLSDGHPEHLSRPVFLINEQWAVTSFGIECVDGTQYHFEKRRVAELRGGTDLLDWPLHMAEKDWVDLTLFERALRFALKKWAPGVPLEIVDRSFARAHGERS